VSVHNDNGMYTFDRTSTTVTLTRSIRNDDDEDSEDSEDNDIDDGDSEDSDNDSDDEDSKDADNDNHGKDSKVVENDTDGRDSKAEDKDNDDKDKKDSDTPPAPYQPDNTKSEVKTTTASGTTTRTSQTRSETIEKDGVTWYKVTYIDTCLTESSDEAVFMDEIPLLPDTEEDEEQLKFVLSPY